MLKPISKDPVYLKLSITAAFLPAIFCATFLTGCLAPLLNNGNVVTITATSVVNNGEVEPTDQWFTRSTNLSTLIPGNMKIHPLAPNRIWAASAAGIWTSDDEGVTWTSRIGDGGFLLSGLIRDIAFSPTDPNTVYVLHSYGFVAKTTDAGAHWVEQSSGLNKKTFTYITYTDLQVAPTNASILYAVATSTTASYVADNGIFKSSNGGTTWSTVHNGLGTDFNRVQKVSIHPTVQDVVVIGTGYSGALGGIYLTTDGGANWTNVSGALGNSSYNHIAISPNGTRVFVNGSGASAGDPCYRDFDTADVDTDGILYEFLGAWVCPSPALWGGSIPTYRSNFQFTPGSPNTISVILTNNSLYDLYRSTDNGVNYTRISTIDRGAVFYYQHPTVATKTYNNGNKFMASNDSGATFYEVGLMPGLADNYYTSHPTTTGVRIGRKYYSTDFGKNWFAYSGVDPALYTAGFIATANNDEGMAAWDLTNPNRCLRAGNHLISPYDQDAVFESTDGCKSFTILSTGFATGGGLKAIYQDPFTNSIKYLTRFSGGGSIFRSNDNGVTWAAKNTGFGANPWVNGFSFDKENDGVIYAAFREYGDTRGIYKSTNRGESWSAINTGFGVTTPHFDAVQIKPNDSDVLYTMYNVASVPSIYRSTDAGANWSAVAHNLPSSYGCSLLSFDKWNSSRMFIQCYNGPNISMDGGVTWTAFNNGLIYNGSAPFIYGIGFDGLDPNKIFATGGGSGGFHFNRSSY